MNFPDKKYNIIYADPLVLQSLEWKRERKKSAENHYKCLDDDDIYKLDVGTLTDDNCVLFLWVTYPLLQEGIRTIKNGDLLIKPVRLAG